MGNGFAWTTIIFDVIVERYSAAVADPRGGGGGVGDAFPPPANLNNMFFMDKIFHNNLFALTIILTPEGVFAQNAMRLFVRSVT